MMTKMIMHFLAFATALSFAACQEQPEETDPIGKEETKPLVLKAAFADPSTPLGKAAWDMEDKAVFMVLGGGRQYSGPFSPVSVSADGTEATFEFPSSYPEKPDACYAYLTGGADSFVDGHSVSVPRVDPESVGAFPVIVARADMGTGTLSFRNLYPHISFTIETTGINNVVFAGSNAEPLSRKVILDLDNDSVTPTDRPEDAPTSLNVTITGPGTYYIPLYPGIKLAGGYTLTAFGANGKPVMTAKSGEALTAEAGRIYAAPSFADLPHYDEFDATRVAYSFGMLSDTHIDTGNGQNCQTKLTAAFQQLQAQASRDDLNGIDAICIAGDFTNTGYNSTGNNTTEIAKFKQLYEAQFDPVKVPMIYAVGNHDPYGQWTSDVYNQSRNIRNCFGAAYATTDVEKDMRDSYECRHCIVGDYHILAVVPYSTNPVGYPSAVTGWLDRTLSEITAADPERYVILLTHPMIYDTVYGSLLGPGWVFGQCTDYWYTKGLTSVLGKYPQVMTFSGHLHFPINDPRSIWQGEFTAFGCGSTRYMAIEDGKYEGMSSTTVMKDAQEVSSGLLLQFDVNGNARITKMFFSQNTTFDYPWEIAHPAGDLSHLQTYSHKLRRASNQAPVLPSLEVSFADASSSMKTVYAKFAAGQDDEFVHHYVVKLKKGSAVLSTKRILADFYKHQWPSQMAGNYTQNMGNFGSGDYTLELEAYDSWDAVTSISKDFTVDAGAVTPSAPSVLYADMTFAGGKVVDTKGKVNVTSTTAAVGQVSVSHKGKTGKLDAVSAGGGKCVECIFNDMKTFDDFQAFASEGFSVEAFFVDRKRGSTAHGVVCGTEAGGWGLATRATGIPYFVVGDVSYNTYVFLDARSAASTTELTHAVAVYDFAKKAIRLYINGTLDAQTSISGPFYPGAGDAFNRFAIGADVKASSTATDFVSADMVVAIARIYTGVMDEKAVSEAYNAAVASIK